MKEAKFTFTFDKDFRVTATPATGVTQTDAVKAMRVLADMRKAVDALRSKLPLN